ncbi:hypothetical protein KCMC57_up27590 [Kitasatospora sp. CMC57]|uniref:Uncharacterized protein n=1 Tax=Kitasatospora sp. CMC57 TaxID=3231513 RepID=A0AB33JT09_9ACTN
MTNSADFRIPGYDGGPFTQRPDLDDPLYWLTHLYSCSHSEQADELLFGADLDAADQFYRRTMAQDGWPLITLTLARDHQLHIVHRNLADDSGTDYLLHHPTWERAELLAVDDGHFMGPGLSWPELAAAADHTPGGDATSDPHARLLLLLPALGDDALPPDAVGRLASALRARTRVEDPDALATALLEGQGQCGPVSWSTIDRGVRVSGGGLSFRNPANDFALPAHRLARVSAALTP